MFKQIITAVVLSGIVMSSSYAETRHFTLTPEYTKTTNYQTKSIGMAALDKQIKLPAYVVYQEDPVGEHVGTLIKNHPTSMTIKHTLDKKYANELAMDFHTAVRYIERVADRSGNIAEYVYYAATGYRFPDNKK